LTKKDENDKALNYLEILTLNADKQKEINQLKCKLYVKKGKKSYDNENYIEAGVFFEQALTCNDNVNTKLIYINLAWAYLGRKDFDKSITYLQQAEKIDPENANIKNIMSLVYNRQGEKFLAEGYDATAILSFNNAVGVSEDTDDNIYKNNLAIAHQNQRSYKNALDDISKIEGKDFEYERTLSLRTEILEALIQDFFTTQEDKVTYYEQLTKLHCDESKPENSKYFYEFAKFLIDNHILPTTMYINLIRQGHEIDPSNQDIIQLIGDENILVGD
jgi:tetratricopeptide (TPR) repeat protein